MTTQPLGIYIEKESKFEFDFATQLLKIKNFKGPNLANTTVSPFRVVAQNDSFLLVVHNYDRTGERKMIVESIDQEVLVIKHENISYRLQKINTNFAA